MSETPELNDVPRPVETGSTGTQKGITPELLPAIKETPFKGLGIAETLQGLTAARPRSLGGEVVGPLITALFQELSRDLQATREELSTTRQDLNAARITIASLQERIMGISRIIPLRMFCVATGVALISFAIDFYRNNFDKAGVMIGLLGVLLLLLGWLSNQRGEGA